MSPSNDSNPLPGDWLRRQASQRPDAPALTLDKGPQFDFRQLLGDASRLAGNLVACGISGGDRLAVQLSSPWQLARVFHAALLLGTPILPIEPTMSAERRRRLLSVTGCGHLTSELEAEGGEIAVISVDALFAAHSIEVAPPEVRPLNSDEAQLLVATSGTTGQPKAVMLSASNLAASVAASRQRLGLEADDCWLLCLPLFHIGGLSILLRCLEAGAGVIICSRFEAASVWDRITTGEVTHLSLVPVMLQQLLECSDGQPPPDSLRVVLVGGGPLSVALARRAHEQGWPICVSYGMSETASQFATDCSAEAGCLPGRVGRPLTGYQVAITDSGRIRVRGPGVMLGYANPLQRPGEGLVDGWFETGDLGRLDEFGCLDVLGRADDLLISGGKNVHPQEVEEAMAHCPGIGAVGVTGCDDAVWGQLLVALYTGPANPAVVEAWCRRELPAYLRPRKLLPVPALPRNAMGKLSRGALKKLLPEAE